MSLKVAFWSLIFIFAAIFRIIICKLVHYQFKSLVQAFDNFISVIVI